MLRTISILKKIRHIISVKSQIILSLTGDIHKLINIRNSEETHYENECGGSIDIDFVVQIVNLSMFAIVKKHKLSQT
jgi:hypothetical protein